MVAGNCGFSLAPLGDEADGDYLKRMMVKVEGMALEVVMPLLEPRCKLPVTALSLILSGGTWSIAARSALRTWTAHWRPSQVEKVTYQIAMPARAPPTSASP